MRHDTTRPAGLSAGSLLRLARELSGMSWVEMGIASGWSEGRLKKIASSDREACSSALLFDVLQATGCRLVITHTDGE